MNSTASVKSARPTQKSKKGEIKEIVFDDDARREYLTGFRKRNLAKKEARAARAKQRQKQELLELRREKRKELAQRAADNYAAVERAYHEPNLSDPAAGPSSATVEPQELEFENEEQLATVTVVENFEVDPLGEHRPSRLTPTGSADSNGEDDNSPNPMTNPSKALSANRSHPQPSAPSAKQTSGKPTTSNSSKSKPTTKKRPAYQTKAERRLDKFKQKARRAEKMEEGKVKRKINGSGGGHWASKGKKQKGGRGKR